MKKPDLAGGPGEGLAPRRLLLLARLSLALLGAAFIAERFSELHFALDNLSNFRVHVEVSFLLCAVFLAWAGGQRFALVSIAGLVIALVPVVPWYFKEPEAAPASPANRRRRSSGSGDRVRVRSARS